MFLSQDVDDNNRWKLFFNSRGINLFLSQNIDNDNKLIMGGNFDLIRMVALKDRLRDGSRLNSENS